jgi:hypothetical protein
VEEAMLLGYWGLRRRPTVFQALTGLRVAEFDQLVSEVLPAYQEAEVARLSRHDRRRAIGGGTPYKLEPRDQILLLVIWLRQYPTHEVLGYLFGISPRAVLRIRQRVLPLLEQAGRDSMRLPRRTPQRSRRQLDALLRDIPELAVVVDTWEQAVQRPQGGRAAADAYYSGKQKRHTLKSQVAVDDRLGTVVAVPASVPGPTHDLALLKASRLLQHLGADIGAVGDLAYVGLAAAHPAGLGATPFRKPRDRPRPPEQAAYNTAFARYRIIVEHTIGRMRRYQCLAQADRHHRRLHTERVRAVAGLVNRALRARFPCGFGC